ncbi:UNVERIFIED_CONTAM: hypothetical protein FKN15_028588 [Acipenser sinensis]
MAKTNTRCPPKRVPSSRPLLFTLQTHRAAAQELQRRRTTRLSGSLQASPQTPDQTTGVAGARFVVDDGSGFAHVVCRNRDVSVLLRLGGAEWEELQREVGVRGHVTYDCRGKSDEDGRKPS